MAATASAPIVEVASAPVVEAVDVAPASSAATPAVDVAPASLAVDVAPASLAVEVASSDQTGTAQQAPASLPENAEFTDAHGKKWNMRSLQKAMNAWGKQERKSDSDAMKPARKNFLAEYQDNNRAQKVKLLLKWGKAGGPKATTKGLVDITMTCLHKSKESREA
eukprot:1677057-Amphidinium_carterae.1